jgi:hypothetical protein
MMTSSTTDSDPMTRKKVFCPLMQCPSICLIQKYWTGQHCKVFPIMAVSPQATTKIMTAVAAYRKRLLRPNSR